MGLKYAYGYVVPPEPVVEVLETGGEFQVFGIPQPPSIIYTITVKNNSTSPTLRSPGDVLITFPVEVQYQSFTATKGTFDGSVWSGLGTMTGQEEHTLVVTTFVDPPTTESPLITVSLSGLFGYSIEVENQLTPADEDEIGLYLFAENACGYTVGSERVSVNFLQSNSISVEVPESAITDATGFLFIHLAIGETVDTATRIYRWQVYDDFGAERFLEPVLLYKDEHLDAGASIALPSDLPTGADRLSGQTRLVVGGVPSSGFYIYNPLSSATPDGVNFIADSTGGVWELTGNPTLGVITDIAADGGCAQPVEVVNPDLVRKHVYEPGIDFPTRQAILGKYYFEPELQPIPRGSPLDLVAYVNGWEEFPVPRTDLLAGSIVVIFRGYVNLTDGTLDKEDDTTPSGLMDEVDLEVLYHPSKTPLTIPKDLELGFAALYEIGLSTSYQVLLANGSPRSLYGTLISFNMFVAQRAGERAGWAELTGDIVLKAGGMLRCVPEIGGVLKKSGHAVIQKFTRPIKAAELVIGFLNNTVDNKVTITGDGAYFIRLNGVEIPPLEAIRAIVSLEEGHSYINWSIPITINNQGLTVTVEHPYSGVTEKSFVRPNYPDIIAGEECTFVPTAFRYYLFNRATLKTYRSISAISVEISETQTFTLDDFSLLEEVEAEEPANDFGLFTPPQPYQLNLVTGDIPNGSWLVGCAYYYSGAEITSISHDPLRGCIPESGLTWLEMIDRVQLLYGLRTLQQLKDSDPNERFPYTEGKIVWGDGRWDWVVWDPSDTSYPDDLNIIAPDDRRVEDPPDSGIFTYPLPGRFQVINKDGSKSWLPPTTATVLKNYSSILFNDLDTRHVILESGKKVVLTWRSDSTKKPSATTIVPLNLLNASGDRLGPGAWEPLVKDNIGIMIAMAAALGD
jgi:hypothetical protein